jgi:uncharacterized protein (TIRG00374 family)
MSNGYRYKRLGSLGLFLAGLAAFMWILWEVGRPAIEANLSAIGWWFPGFVGLFLVAQLFFFAGWWILIDTELLPSNPWGLFGIYLAGDSFNYLIPSANMAGEPLKAHLLRKGMGFGHALTSITIHKHAELVAQWLFLVFGVAVCLLYFNLPGSVQLIAITVVAGMGGGLLLLTRVLKRGTYGPIIQKFANLKMFSNWISQYQSQAYRLDSRIQTFYQQESGRFLAAVGWCFLGWCGGLLETYLVLRLLAPEWGWPTAISIEALAMILNNLIFFIPGRVGSAEGVRVGLFLLFGLPAAQGVVYSLVRRGREVLWLIPGFLVLLANQGRRVGQSELPHHSQ